MKNISFKVLSLGISCKNHAVGCDFTAEIDSVLTHEEDCPHRTVRCVVLSCYRVMRFNDVEVHMTEHHKDMLTGDWVVHDQIKGGALVVPDGVHYAMKTWYNANARARFFATLFVSRVVSFIDVTLVGAGENPLVDEALEGDVRAGHHKL